MSRVLMFASNRPFKEIPFPEDFEIHIDTKRRTVDDGGGDDLFGISPTNGYPEIKTDMKYFAELAWQYTPGRAARIIEYIREHLKTTDEVELWHVWLDSDLGFGHRIRKRIIPIDGLTVDILREIDQLPIWKEAQGLRPQCRKQSSAQIDLSEWEETVTDYCCVITAPKGSAL